MSAAGNTSDFLETDILEGDYLWEIHSIVALNAGSSITQAAVGYVSTGVFHILKKDSADNPFQSVGFYGKADLRAGMKIRAQFYNTTAGEGLYLFVNGIRRQM